MVIYPPPSLPHRRVIRRLQTHTQTHAFEIECLKDACGSVGNNSPATITNFGPCALSGHLLAIFRTRGILPKACLYKGTEGRIEFEFDSVRDS